MESISNSKKIIQLNMPQMLVGLIQANETWLLWGRGTGKTVGGIGPWMIRVAEAMPRHLGGIFGKDFETIEKNILPKFIQGMEMSGYYRDVHFVIGKRPPSHFDTCLYSLKKWDKTIAWHNGTVFQEVSLYNRGSANAFDFQSGVFDEVKFMDPNQLEDEVYPTFRGYDKIFGHLPEYLAKIYATDKYADYLTIKWILDKRKRVDHRKVSTVIQLQLHLSELYPKMAEAKPREQVKIRQLIRDIQVRLNLLRKDMVYVSEAKATENRDNLGEKWLDDKKRTMNRYEFDVAIMNEDPIKAENSFYPTLSMDNVLSASFQDYDMTKPLVIAMDYQHSVAPMCVTQKNRLPGADKPSINFIQEFYTQPPHGLEECVDEFCKAFQTHMKKLVYYVYDSTAVGERQSAARFKDIVVNRFRANGWSVVECYTGVPPEHYLKYEKIKTWLQGPKDQPMLVRFNARCEKTIISMQGSGVVVHNGKTKKDKKYELTHRYRSVDQTETTHFSDCVDQLLWYHFNMQSTGAEQGGGIAFA